MNVSTQFSLGYQLLPDLRRCTDCGGSAQAYLDGENIGFHPEQPFVYIRCDHCSKRISSSELLGDLTNVPILDKLTRIATLWNREVYRPRLSSKAVNSKISTSIQQPHL